MDTKDISADVIAVLAIIVAFVAARWAKRDAARAASAAEKSAASGKESATAATRSADAADRSADIADKALLESRRIFESQKLLSQRQFLVSLWDYMTSVNHINPESPATPQVLKAAHTLELVALCCEHGAVDETMIRRTFGRTYRQLFAQIRKCKKLPGLDIDGEQLLDECPAARAFFDKLDKEHVTAHEPTAKP